MVATAASTIHLFTGNNIGPRGDLASRSLEIRLELDRYDPENREFKHPDPIGWTDSMRSEILHAFYTILLGNPTLKKPRNAPMKTRFRMWYRLVGSAVEHAAKLAIEYAEPGAYESDGLRRPYPVDFQKLFLAREEDDEDSTSLSDALEIMLRVMPSSFDAADLARFISVQPTDQYGAPRTPDTSAASLREFLYPSASPNHVVTPKSVAKLLKLHVDEPVKVGERTLILRKQEDLHTKMWSYFIEVGVG
jgi:hypothetical protein